MLRLHWEKAINTCAQDIAKRSCPGPLRDSRPSQVTLNVYDLTPMNDWGYPVGLGAFHSGVVVDDREYTYAGGGGIFNHDPRKGEIIE